MRVKANDSIKLGMNNCISHTLYRQAIDVYSTVPVAAGITKVPASMVISLLSARLMVLFPSWR